MVKLCEDFIYSDQALSQLGFTTADFHNDEEIPLALQREIIKGETNNYRKRANHITTTYSGTLEMEFHLIKKAYDRRSLDDLEISKHEIRAVTRWLSSVSRPALLQIAVPEADEDLFYFGLFTNIETFTAGGRVYGLILTFTNDSPFAYSDIITDTFELQGHIDKVIDNNSDLLDDYCYPVIHIAPGEKGDFYLCNFNDTELLTEGKFSLGEDADTAFEHFLQKIETYAVTKGYTTDYYYDSQYKFITIADDTAIRFKYRDSNADEYHCFAYYQPDGSYKILKGGFLSLSLLKDLPITIDCELLTIYDDLGRMVLFKDIGLADEDYIYWPRLKDGTNTLHFFGSAGNVTFTRREMIKAGVL